MGLVLNKSHAHADTNTALKPVTITLTPLHWENLYKHFAWNNDPELNRLDSEYPYEKETLGAFKQRFEQMISHPAPDAQDFEILADDGTVIGTAYVARIRPHNRNCTIGITIGDRDYWGKGYGRAALRALLVYCFDELGMHRVSTEVFEYNAAWQKLAVWAGFKKEGTDRDYLFRDGQFWDKHDYGILEEEYRASLPKAA